jgi:hypothetical protein
VVSREHFKQCQFTAEAQSTQRPRRERRGEMARFEENVERRIGNYSLLLYPIPSSFLSAGPLRALLLSGEWTQLH